MGNALVLFDVDGTLIRARGAGRAALQRAFADLFAAPDPFEGVRFHGSTDFEILDAGLDRAGIGREHGPVVLGRYLSHLATSLDARSGLAIPAASALLRELSAREGVCLGLVTGNVAEGARIKLAPDGLCDWFAVGAFGCDGRDRADLIRLAWERAHAAGYGPFDAGRVAYVGDTERDVEAGLRAGVVAVGVATGPVGAAALEAAGARVVYGSLPDAETFLEEVFA